MRKSERIRILELSVLKMQMEMELLQGAISILLDQNNVKQPDMDSGKWYNKNFPNN